MSPMLGGLGGVGVGLGGGGLSSFLCGALGARGQDEARTTQTGKNHQRRDEKALQNFGYEMGNGNKKRRYKHTSSKFSQYAPRRRQGGPKMEEGLPPHLDIQFCVRLLFFFFCRRDQLSGKTIKASQENGKKEWKKGEWGGRTSAPGKEKRRKKKKRRTKV